MLRNGDFNANRLATLLAELAAAPDRLAAAAAAALGVGAPDAAARLADLVERLAPANGAMRRAA
jgi:UDP-N-acetylglucosamine--N-acetylmuramyl-(pentapeptide) pyrophosphoryl-undecaprenol N-acetylglucosamine transferase